MPTGNDLSDIRYENIVLRDKNSELENEIEKLNNEGVEKWAKGIERFMQGIIVGIIAGVSLAFIAIK